MISVDPGDPAGIYFWEGSGEGIYGDQFSLDRLAQYVSEAGYWWNLEHIVYEDFRLRKGKALQQSGSRFETSQSIGMLKVLAKTMKAELHRQNTDPLTVASMWSGVKMPSNHKESHVISAFLHGYYWLVGQGIVVPEIPDIE